MEQEKAYKVYVVAQYMPGCMADNVEICRTLSEAFDCAKQMKDWWLDAWWENGGKAYGNIRKVGMYDLVVDNYMRERISINDEYLTAKEIAESYLMEGGDLLDMGWPKAVEEEFINQQEEQRKRWHTN